MSTSKERILDSIKQLSNLGYHDFQIDSILRETIDTVYIDSLTPAQSEELLEALSEHINFAIKCVTGRGVK